MKKSKVTALKQKGWELEKESEKALSQAKSDEAVAQIASAMKDLTAANQAFIREAIEKMGMNNEAIITLISTLDGQKASVESPIPEVVRQPTEDAQVVDDEEKKQWELLVSRNRDGFISVVRITQTKGDQQGKEFAFVFKRDAERFISNVEVKEI